MSPSIEQTDKTFLFHIKQKFQCLKSSDLTVMLLVDKIHLKRYFDYKEGTIIGSSYYNVCNAKSAFAFMISSVFSKYKDVFHLLPTCKISANDLNAMLKKVIIGLEDIGFRNFLLFIRTLVIIPDHYFFFLIQYIHCENCEL